MNVKAWSLPSEIRVATARIQENQNHKGGRTIKGGWIFLEHTGKLQNDDSV